MTPVGCAQVRREYAAADDVQEQVREYAELNNRFKTWRYHDALTMPPPPAEVEEAAEAEAPESAEVPEDGDGDEA